LRRNSLQVKPTVNNRPVARLPFSDLLKHIVIEIVEGIDVTELVEPKMAYTPDEVADLAGFKNGIAVVREAQSGLLIGTKVRGNWRFTRQQILDYLQNNEVTV
jgi:uncharacterized ferredoxin-like protein